MELIIFTTFFPLLKDQLFFFGDGYKFVFIYSYTHASTVLTVLYTLQKKVSISNAILNFNNHTWCMAWNKLSVLELAMWNPSGGYNHKAVFY